MICPSCQAENDTSADTCFRCGRGLFALVEGALLAGRYEIIKPLGKGGMGLVYKARDRDLEETVAVKVLRADASGASLDVAKRFRSEIKLARRITHRNVCRIHEYGQAGHIRYIVMEHIEGVNLKQLLQSRGSLPASDAFEAALQIAEGLQAIHDVGIVHRDLKTPNIMRDENGVIRLMDFGIAKQFDAPDTTAATATGQVVGTPEYMSPEQARGEHVDARSDIYALGVVLFELFTGEVPFRGDTPLATLWKHMQEPPPLEGAKASKLPPPLAPVLARALAKDREGRFSSARAMADSLREAHLAFEGMRPDGQASVPIQGLASVRIVERPAAATPPAPPPTAISTAVPTPRTATAIALGAGRSAYARAVDPKAFPTVRPAGRIEVREPGRARRRSMLISFSLLLAAGAGLWFAQSRMQRRTTEPGIGLSPAYVPPLATTLAPQPGPAQATVQPLAGASVASPPGGPATAVAAEVSMPPGGGSKIDEPDVSRRVRPSPGPTVRRPTTEITTGAPSRIELPPGLPPTTGSVPTPAVSEAPPMPSPAPPVAAPPTTLSSAVNDEAAIRAVIAAYKRAIETKDLSLFAAIKPNLSASEQRLLNETFSRTRSLRVDITIRSVQIDGNKASAFVLRRDVVDGRAVKEIHQVLKFSRLSTEWVIAEIGR